MNQQNEQPPPSRFSRRMPVFLSAFVCPGAGQLMQKRWVAAGVYCTGFMAPFLYLIAYVLYHVFDNLKNVISWNNEGGGKPLETLSFTKIGISFLVAMVFYFAGLIDTYRAEQRKIRNITASAAAGRSE